MISAQPQDKKLVVKILSESFSDNLSVNYLIPQNSHKHKRIQRLMKYSFDSCMLFGKIYLSDDKKACALLLYPELKRTSFRSAWLDLKLIMGCIGIGNILKAIRRENKINALKPQAKMAYLWFVGVLPQSQQLGLGTRLMQELITQHDKHNRPIYLETSAQRNLPWYKKLGFETYTKLDLGYMLYFLRRERP